MTSSPTPENSLRRNFRLYLIVGGGALLCAAFVLGFIGLLIVAGASQFVILGLGVVVTVSGLSGLLLTMVFIAGRHQVAEVDDLLSGKTLIAHWRFDVDENNRPRSGYAYIGAKGIYKDGTYHYFAERSRRLIAVVYEEGHPPKLRFVYEVFGRPNSRSSVWSSQRNDLLVPIPLDKADEARRVVAEFNMKMHGAPV